MLNPLQWVKWLPLGEMLGAGEGTRTPNLLFTRQLRYRLRHASMTDIALVEVL